MVAEAGLKLHLSVNEYFNDVSCNFLSTDNLIFFTNIHNGNFAVIDAEQDLQTVLKKM
jgi:hypothetical protein